MTAVPISETLKVAQEVHKLLGEFLTLGIPGGPSDLIQNALELQSIVVSDLEFDLEEA